MCLEVGRWDGGVVVGGLCMCNPHYYTIPVSRRSESPVCVICCLCGIGIIIIIIIITNIYQQVNQTGGGMCISVSFVYVYM